MSASVHAHSRTGTHSRTLVTQRGITSFHRATSSHSREFRSVDSGAEAADWTSSSPTRDVKSGLRSSCPAIASVTARFGDRQDMISRRSKGDRHPARCSRTLSCAVCAEVGRDKAHTELCGWIRASREGVCFTMAALVTCIMRDRADVLLICMRRTLVSLTSGSYALVFCSPGTLAVCGGHM